MEMTIHDVGSSERYPDGIKYGLLLLDLRSGERVLMDNHYPKGPHVHLDQTEAPYDFTGIDRLIEDFKTFALTHLGVSI